MVGWAGGGVRANIEGGLRGISKDRSVPSPIPPKGQTLIYTHATYTFKKKQIKSLWTATETYDRHTQGMQQAQKHTHTHIYAHR